jgi:HK97 family phage portal protein
MNICAIYVRGDDLKFRNAIKAIFGGIKKYITSGWREIGTYNATFSAFGSDIYANEVVRACIRTLAEHTSKANVKVLRDGGPGDRKIQRMIQYRPNLYMNGKDFLYKVRTLLEINNVVFIYIMRDEFGKCVGLYPMPTAQLEAVEASGGLYITFRFPSGVVMTHSWEDLAVLRKDYNTSDIWGDSNGAILTSLDLLNTTNEGMANAIKSTANLRGILKTTKAMLSPEDAKKQKDRFVEDYMGLANSSGIAMLDATQSFEPIEIKPAIANYKNVEELRNNIYRYFGVNEDAVLSKLSGDAWDAFYEAKIEPVLIALGLELTNKIFTDRERGFENEIIFESNKMQYMSTANKLALTAFVDRAIMTPNEVREVLNLAPVEWGDKPMSWQNPQMGEETEANDDNEG